MKTYTLEVNGRPVEFSSKTADERHVFSVDELAGMTNREIMAEDRMDFGREGFKAASLDPAIKNLFAMKQAGTISPDEAALLTRLVGVSMSISSRAQAAIEGHRW